MQVSKYLYKHFAQLNCHNLNYGVKITSAVLLQYVKALGFRVLTLKFYGKPKRNNFSIRVKLLLSTNIRCCPKPFAAQNAMLPSLIMISN